MNYFAHGMRFVDRPWFLAGTALPDWLSLVNRRVRLRPKTLAPWADGSTTVEAELAAGALQHLEDDRWFHKTLAFAEATARLTKLFRDYLGPGDNFRCGLIAHITTELILDAILIEKYPQRLEAYYDVLGQLDAKRLAQAVTRLAGVPVDMAPWLPRFCETQFLRDYADSGRLAFRLNQVLRRIKLEPLPAGIEGPLTTARGIVTQYAPGLLPPSQFTLPADPLPHLTDTIEANR